MRDSNVESASVWDSKGRHVNPPTCLLELLALVLYVQRSFYDKGADWVEFTRVSLKKKKDQFHLQKVYGLAWKVSTNQTSSWYASLLFPSSVSRVKRAELPV